MMFETYEFVVFNGVKSPFSLGLNTTTLRELTKSYPFMKKYVKSIVLLLILAYSFKVCVGNNSFKVPDKVISYCNVPPLPEKPTSAEKPI